jgi:uroporphyrinogen-III decarboxylase
MYLRSLIGPLDLMYKFYDEPELIHSCMEAWLVLADFVTAKYQEHFVLDEILLDEDICYNHGSLISPAMMEEFLLPYYQQLVANVKRRQALSGRHLYILVATDGFCPPVMPFYEKIGMDVMSPFEAAAGNDVIEIGRQYPNLVISGGMDKRILAAGKGQIDEMVNRIMPVMKARGGYIPTCDHGVPEEVNFENYIHFRKRLLEYS